MAFLDLVHVRERRCERCDCILAEPGARSFIVDADGMPVHFDVEHPPAEMHVGLTCPKGHQMRLSVPDDVSAEATMMTPDDAPIAVDALLVETVPSPVRSIQ